MTAAVAVGVWTGGGGSGVIGDFTSGCGFGVRGRGRGRSAGLAVFFVSAPALPVSTVMTTATTMPITTTAMATARPRRRQ